MRPAARRVKFVRPHPTSPRPHLRKSAFGLRAAGWLKLRSATPNRPPLAFAKSCFQLTPICCGPGNAAAQGIPRSDRGNWRPVNVGSDARSPRNHRVHEKKAGDRRESGPETRPNRRTRTIRRPHWIQRVTRSAIRCAAVAGGGIRGLSRTTAHRQRARRTVQVRSLLKNNVSCAALRAQQGNVAPAPATC